jgi:hypothetical protein
MLVPEAAVHENHLSAGDKDHVRPAWENGDMEPETVAESVDKASNCKLRLRALAADGAHIRTSTLSRNAIHEAAFASVKIYSSDMEPDRFFLIRAQNSSREGGVL